MTITSAMPIAESSVGSIRSRSVIFNAGKLTSSSPSR